MLPWIITRPASLTPVIPVVPVVPVRHLSERYYLLVKFQGWVSVFFKNLLSVTLCEQIQRKIPLYKKW